MSRLQTFCVASVVVIVFGFLTARDLGRQGPYYDELHQAPSAFHYIGSNPLMFTWAYRGVPMLNMTYSGAIKSVVYGIILRYGLHQFGIISWRLLGITFVTLGLIGFYALAGKLLPLGAAVLFAALLLTDISVILTTRHDWGPTALALGLRLIFLGLWLSIELGKSNDTKIGTAAFVVGFSIFEKLSSVVLLGPLLVLLFTARTRGRRSWVAAAVGLFIGASPLIVANYSTYRHGHGFISLSDTKSDKDPFSVAGLIDYSSNFLSLGQGELARSLILGQQSNGFVIKAEGLLTALAVLLIVIDVISEFRTRRLDRPRWFPGILTGSYIMVAIGLLVLPRATFVHHWIIGTPFQYAAIALVLTRSERRSARQRVLQAVVVCLIVLRIPTLVAVERSLTSGPTSPGFDPGLNRLALFAANHAGDAIFISSDWGSGTQMYCGSNGSDNTVFEPFWGTAPAQGALNIVSATKKRSLYIVTTGLSPQFSKASEEITHSIATSADWKSAPLDDALSDFGHIQVRKFVRRME